MRNRELILFLTVFVIFTACNQETTQVTKEVNWQLGPFVKQDADNPILGALDSTLFYCPVRQADVAWEAKDVFNPAAIVRNDTIFMLYRAEDTVGIYSGTSRLGLAWSVDGTRFIRNPQPVFYPDNDGLENYEWEGGVEDPRITRMPKGEYIVTYTSYDGHVARLNIATTPDLLNWEKYGPAFQSEKYINEWSKSGAIVSESIQNIPTAIKINGKYWMYWGDTDIFLATSNDLIHWEPFENEDGTLKKILSPREAMFDSRLVEPGPPAMITENGILLIYNGMNKDEGGDPELAAGVYSGGQALFDLSDPGKLINRSTRHFITPDKDYEITGQVGNVCFVEGLVHYKEKWFLYYGTADSKIAVAVAK